MGAWGYRSYDTDSCMDEIPVSFIDKEPTKSQIEKTLKKVFSPSKMFYTVKEKMEIRLGVIVYLLNISQYPNTLIAKEYLQKALRYARNLKSDKMYLVDWNNSKARKNQLEKEIQLIQKAKGI